MAFSYELYTPLWAGDVLVKVLKLYYQSAIHDIKVHETMQI